MAENEKNTSVDNEEEELEIITLHNNDTGSDDEYYVLAELDYEDGNSYVYLIATEDNDVIEEDEMLIFQLIHNEDGSEDVVSVDDEDKLAELYDYYCKLLDEEYGEDGEGGENA